MNLRIQSFQDTICQQSSCFRVKFQIPTLVLQTTIAKTPVDMMVPYETAI